MTRRFAVSIAFTLLLGGCGDSATPQAPATSPTPASLAATANNKGIDFAEREDWDAAIACYSEAIRLKPDDPDFYNNRVHVLSKAGAYVRTLGGNGEGNGNNQLHYPLGVAVEPGEGGRLYVADRMNHRVLVFLLKKR